MAGAANPLEPRRRLPTEPVIELIAEKVAYRPSLGSTPSAIRVQLRRKLLRWHCLLDPITALEWCLYEFGAGSRKRLPTKTSSCREELREAVSRLVCRVDHDYRKVAPTRPGLATFAGSCATLRPAGPSQYLATGKFSDRDACAASAGSPSRKLERSDSPKIVLRLLAEGCLLPCVGRCDRRQAREDRVVVTSLALSIASSARMPRRWISVVAVWAL